ncbi:hypothetical protein HDV06_001696 [Boothiomyces sp. JEL0866]|nr:hypothetical protein HDV06_001696 [Boothiomyces sp. JEL0866]
MITLPVEILNRIAEYNTNEYFHLLYKRKTIFDIEKINMHWKNQNKYFIKPYKSKFFDKQKTQLIKNNNMYIIYNNERHGLSYKKEIKWKFYELCYDCNEIHIDNDTHIFEQHISFNTILDYKAAYYFDYETYVWYTNTFNVKVHYIEYLVLRNKKDILKWLTTQKDSIFIFDEFILEFKLWSLDREMLLILQKLNSICWFLSEYVCIHYQEYFTRPEDNNIEEFAYNLSWTDYYDFDIDYTKFYDNDDPQREKPSNIKELVISIFDIKNVHLPLRFISNNDNFVNFYYHKEYYSGKEYTLELLDEYILFCNNI